MTWNFGINYIFLEDPLVLPNGKLSFLNKFRIAEKINAEASLTVFNGFSTRPYIITKMGLQFNNKRISTTQNQSWKSIPGIQVVFYADDLAIIFSNQNKEEIQQKLNKALELLNEWTEKNEMVINKEKTKFQIFSMSNTIKTLNMKLNETSLKQGE